MGFEDQNTSPPINPREERVHSDNYVLNELKRLQVQSSDVFGKQIADGTRNEFDYASNYNFSPERLRLFINGSNVNPQYTSDSRFTDTEETWDLSPNSGDAMRIETAESITYRVGYTVTASNAFQLTQSLQDGDVFRWGAFNETDGWVLEQRGADHTDAQADIIEHRNGSRTTLESDVELSEPTTDWSRYELRYSWYNVGGQEWIQSYTDDGEHINDLIAKTSKDSGRGPQTGNLNIRTEVEASSSTNDLTLEVGSYSSLIFGTPATLNRNKPQVVNVTPSGTSDTWEPIYAIRVDPNNDGVNPLFTELEILDYGPSATIELVLVGFDKDLTDATGFSEPEYHNQQNSAMQTTTNISEVPNESGTQTTLGTNENYGGYFIFSSVDVDGGNIAGATATQNEAAIDQNFALRSDTYVILARTGSSGELWFKWSASQNW